MISSGDGEEGTYYSGITATSGESLINQLNALISIVTAGKGNQNSSYEEVKDILEEADLIIGSTTHLWGIYDSESIPKPWVYGGETWNREHVWPQSRLGTDATPSGRNIASDPHNLRAIIPTTNTSRLNRYFVNGTGLTGDIVGANGYYPGDAHRGDVARILLYGS